MFIVSSPSLGPETELGISASEHPFDYPPRYYFAESRLWQAAGLQEITMTIVSMEADGLNC